MICTLCLQASSACVSVDDDGGGRVLCVVCLCVCLFVCMVLILSSGERFG